MSCSITLLCGGPSAERGISINTARSLLDHFSSLEVVISVLYFNLDNQAYAISPTQLYSNTPSDFDFKLAKTGVPLDEKQWCALLKQSDLAFPAIHGAFGEDGHLQSILESEKIPFVGPSAETCRRMFNKYEVAQTLSKAGMPTMPQLKWSPDMEDACVSTFFAEHVQDRAIVKPVQGGSSIDVFAVSTVSEALERARWIAARYASGAALIEPYCRGREFTVIVLQNAQGKPVPLIPSEIEKENVDTIFDYRGKYLPTSRVLRHCPPNFHSVQIEAIREGASKVFSLFGMRDFARLDGWLMPDGEVLFTDLNPISGMEQNSFIFQQAAVVGLKHSELLRILLDRASERYGLIAPSPISLPKNRRRVHVIFGGNTAERQVSVMSGTNVWLKLQNSRKFDALPFLLGSDLSVWQLPYALTLNHTVEEIEGLCKKGVKALPPADLLAHIRCELGFSPTTELWFAPSPLSLEAFYQRCQDESAFVFLGLHGGIGEDGTIQAELDSRHLAYNGTGPSGSRLCMDKYATGQRVMSLEIEGVGTARKKLVDISSTLIENELDNCWVNLCNDLGTPPFIAKPMADGCSAGIIKICSKKDFLLYAKMLHSGISYIKPNTFENQADPIEMPPVLKGPILIEQYIQSDRIEPNGVDLAYKRETGWIEMTIGVRELKKRYQAMNPSITLARGVVLSLEEKFQGGTGVNITSPPVEIVSEEMLFRTKRMVEKIAEGLEIQNYARIDLFLNVLNGEIIVIEANTLPGLTPSTVIYHQALAEVPSQDPTSFLENIITDACQDRLGETSTFLAEVT